MAALSMVWFLMLPAVGLIALFVLCVFLGSIWAAFAGWVRGRYWDRSYTREQIEAEKARDPEFDETRVEVFNPEYDELLSEGHVFLVSAYRAEERLSRRSARRKAGKS